MTTLAPDVRTEPVVLVVEGELRAGSLPRLRDLLEASLATRPPQLVLDLSRCPFVDAAGLGLLLELHRSLARSGGVLTLRGCTPRVLRVLSLTNLRRVFDLA